MSIWICIVIGIVIGFIVAGVMKSQLKSVHQERAAANYLTEGSLNLVVNTDIFLYENTTRTPKAKNDNKK